MQTEPDAMFIYYLYLLVLRSFYQYQPEGEDHYLNAQQCKSIFKA
jgi:hypothetical protein